MKTLILAVSFAAMLMLSGCATLVKVNVRTAGIIAPSVEKLVVNNGSDFVLIPQSNGKPLVKLQRGSTAILGYYQLFDYSTKTVNAKAYCPDTEGLRQYNFRLARNGQYRNMVCNEGDYVGEAYARPVTVTSGQGFHAQEWNIKNQDIIDSSGRSYQ